MSESSSYSDNVFFYFFIIVEGSHFRKIFQLYACYGIYGRNIKIAAKEEWPESYVPDSESESDSESDDSDSDSDCDGNFNGPFSEVKEALVAYDIYGHNSPFIRSLNRNKVK